MTAAGGQEAGGFLNPTLPSPAPSTATAATSTASTAWHLPRQRMHPLKPGGVKESALISYVDRKILQINRRHAKKFSSNLEEEAEAEEGQEESGESRGYESFKEVVKDINEVIDVVWISGTPSLQTPYLISLAGLINTYLPEYPIFQPKPTFRLLSKLDVMFASLLVGEDVESGVPLAGFETTRHVLSMTEKVRIKSVAEASRVVVVEKYQNGDGEGEEDDDDEDDGEEVADGMDVDRDHVGAGSWEMEAARVYERTIQYLGDELGKAGLVI